MNLLLRTSLIALTVTFGVTAHAGGISNEDLVLIHSKVIVDDLQQKLNAQASKDPYELSTVSETRILAPGNERDTEASLRHLLKQAGANSITSFRQVHKNDLEQALRHGLESDDSSILCSESLTNVSISVTELLSVLERTADSLEIYEARAADSNQYEIDSTIILNPIDGRMILFSIQTTE